MYAKKNSGKKVVATLLAIVLLIGGIVGGTIAYLMDTTNEIENTFTAGDVDIELTETNPTNQTAKMVPGATIDKNPKVTVKAISEACYLFVKIEESTSPKLTDYITYSVITGDNGWTALPNVSGVYYRTVADTDADQEFAILTDNKVTVNTTVTKAQMEAIDGKDADGNTNSEKQPTLSFTAYAIQSDNLADQNGDNTVDVADAWALINATP